MARTFAVLGVTTVGAHRALAQPTARLDDGGMGLRLFRPAIDSKGFLSVNGAEVLGGREISFGLLLDGALGIVPFHGFANDAARTADDAERTERLVDEYLTGTIHFDYGIESLAMIGVELPLHALRGANVTARGAYNDGPSPAGLHFQGIGDVSAHGKIRLSRPGRDAVGVAALLRVELPTGDASVFAGSPGVTISPALAAEWRPWSALRLVANGGSRVVLREGTRFPIGARSSPAASSATNPSLPAGGATIADGTSLTFGCGVGLRVGDALELVAESYGAQLLRGIGERSTFSAEALLGLKVFVERSSYLVAALGAGLPTEGYAAADFRGVVGFVFEPSIGDRDADGLPDDLDRCVDEPEDHDAFADDDGCPDADNDRDGLLDADDECPVVPEDHDGDADGDGCPESDHRDRDGDGLLDDLDRCPDDPEDRDGFEDEDGCPDGDNDRDGLLDSDDLCPNAPEDRDGFEDDDGCPEDNPVTRSGTRLVLLENIYFETDSAVIRSRSLRVIDAIAAELAHHPELMEIEIQGHADERADDDYNLRLTRDRAASVRDALLQRGIDSARLRSAGYGERCPIQPGHDEAAWQANRRVEFVIVRTAEGPTQAALSCTGAPRPP